MFCQGEKDISAPAPVPLHCSALCAPWAGLAQSMVVAGKKQAEGLQAAQRRGNPTSFPSPMTAAPGVGEMVRAGEDSWGNG